MADHKAKHKHAAPSVQNLRSRQRETQIGIFHLFKLVDALNSRACQLTQRMSCRHDYWMGSIFPPKSQHPRKVSELSSSFFFFSLATTAPPPPPPLQVDRTSTLISEINKITAKQSMESRQNSLTETIERCYHVDGWPFRASWSSTTRLQSSVFG